VAATVKIYEYYGAASSAAVPVSGAKFCTMGSNNPGSANPMVRPNDATTNYSFEKYFALFVETSASSYINNVKAYTDGATLSGEGQSWAGVALYWGVTSAYAEPQGTIGSTGDQSSIATSAAFQYVAANKLGLSTYVTVVSGGATGIASDYLVMQAAITSAAGPGSLGSESISIEYDEV
jgi:hypothetical protein